MKESMKITATYEGQTERFHRFVIKEPMMNGRIYILKQAEIPRELVIELKTKRTEKRSDGSNSSE